MKTRIHSCANSLRLTIAAALLASTAAPAAINGPYVVDANTLHLWHLDEADPGPAAPAAGVAGSFNLTPDAGKNGVAPATLGNAAFVGFGTAGDTSANASSGLKGVSIPVSNVTGANGAFTFEAMVNIANATDGQQIVSMEGNGGGATRPFQFRIDGDQVRFINIGAGGGTVLIPIPTTGPDAFVPNEWFHVAVTYNGEEGVTDNTRIYWTRVDATRIVANEIGTGTMSADLGGSPSIFGVGNLYRTAGTGNTNNLEGQIDEVRISDIARAADDMLFGVAGPDEDPPLLATTDPVDDAPAGVAVSATFTASFNEDLQAGTGNITIRNLTDMSDTDIPVTDTNQVSISGTTVTIDPSADLTAEKDYAVLIDATAIEDLAGNAFAGIADDTTWNFSTDGTPPSAVAFTPADDAVEVLVGANLTATFDEPVVAGAGTITIKRTGDNTVVEAFNVTSAPQLTFSGNTVTINPASDLPAATGLYVEIDATAIKDLAENDFAGISDPTAWSFTTAASQSTVMLFADDFSDGSLGAPVDPNAPGSSISGTLAGSFLGDPYLQVNVGGGTLGGEAGGEASWSNLNAPNPGSGLITPDTDFAANSTLANAQQFTVRVLGLNPVDDGDGTSGNWTAVNMFQPAPPTNAGDPTVTRPTTGLGVFFRDNGLVSVWSAGATIAGDTFDAAPANGSYDIAIEVTNISGLGPDNSFDYQVLVDGVPVAGVGGTLTGIDTSANFITLESRNSSSTLSEVRIETVASDIDLIAPALTGLSPADDAPAVLATANLLAVFDEPVVAGTGTIEVRRTIDDTLVEDFNIASSEQITVSGGILTIDPSADLPDGDLYVLIPATALADAAGNSFAGITDPTAWNFTVDGTAPSSSGMAPMADATGVAPFADLTLSFGEDVLAGTGNITIFLAADDSVVEAIDVTSGAVTIAGAEATINPAADLAYNTAYYVQIDAGTFTDLAGNDFAGISDATTWAFTTAPVPTGLIFSEDFAGDGTDLSGTAPDTSPFGETWVAAELFNQDGSTEDSAGSATLSFAPSPGLIYSLDASFSNLGLAATAGDPENDWLALGFVNGQSAASGGNDRFITGNVVGAAWMLTRGDSSQDPDTFAWLGNGQLGGGNNGLAGDNAELEVNTGSAIDMRVVLDTTGGAEVTDWTATWYAKVPADSTYAVLRGPENLLAGTTITAVGLARSNPGITGTVESFSLRTVAPEPLVLNVTENGGLLDFSWNSMASMQYDLVSSTNPEAEPDPALWALYDDGVNPVYENIAASGTGTTTLTGVTKLGTTRFFALIEEPGPPLVSEDFESGAMIPGDWEAVVTEGTGTAWEVGTPTDVDNSATGPTAAANGTFCAGTNISADYTADVIVALRSNAFTVPLSGATLSFSQYIDTDEAGTPPDVGSIRLLNAADNTPLTGGDVAVGLEGATELWSSESIALPAVANGLEVRLEFRFDSNDSSEFAGFYIDDVVVTGN